MQMEEIVTLKLTTYNELLEELKYLKQKVEEKTIIKEILPSIYGYIFLITFVSIIIFSWINIK